MSTRALLNDILHNKMTIRTHSTRLNKLLEITVILLTLFHTCNCDASLPEDTISTGSNLPQRLYSQWSCGQKCLYTLWRLDNKNAKIEDVFRVLPEAEYPGVTFLQIQKSAEQLAIYLEGRNVPPSRIEDISTPAIALIRLSCGLGHYIVIRNIDGEIVDYIDPTSLEATFIRSSSPEFARMWTGRVLTIRSNKRENILYTLFGAFTALIGGVGARLIKSRKVLQKFL